jgi:DNA-directed RNA polymerase I, II, and III subunit RPABC1
MVSSDVEMDQTASSAPTLRGGLSPEASRLFRVYKTVSAMLFKRGYMVSRDMREMTPTSFTQKFGEHPSREALTILVVSENIRNIPMM